MVGIPNDYVVENFDLQQLTCSNKIACNFDIRLGRSWLAARMIVTDDDGCCTCHDCQSKNLPGMTENRIHRAYGHQIVTFDAPTCVEDEYHQTFTFRIEVWMIGDVRFPIGSCLVWCLALLHGVRCGTFPE